MKKITNFVVDKRNYILVLFIILSMVSLGLSSKVNINYDISKYLPNDAETRIGMDIMDNQFEEDNSSSLEVMFYDLDSNKKEDIYNKLSNIEGVSSIDYDDTSNYNKDNYTLYILHVNDKSDSKLASSVYKEVKNTYKDNDVYMSGDIYDRNYSVLPVSIVALAIGSAMVILIVMCESYIEPFLFLFAIGLAVFLNNGTNIIFDSVSNITSSISAILQMALSMDYSIMLINRYRQEREKTSDKVTAMKNALYNAFKSISSSSITTIVGLIVLVFMSFTIGRDLGYVLAKGVLLSLISIFCCLPGLILLFDKLIKKTEKKSLNINLSKLGNISFKFSKLAVILFIIAFISSFFLKGNLKILYTEGETNEINEIFTENNQIAVIYNNQDEEKLSTFCKKLENDKKISNCLSYGNTIGEELTTDKINSKIKSLGADITIDESLLKILQYNYHNPNNNIKLTLNEFTRFLDQDVLTNSNFKDKINPDLKNNITKLSNFTNKELITKKRTSRELADILDIDKEVIDNIFIYYLSINNNTSKLSIPDFINLINNDILPNKNYATLLDKDTKDNISILTKFSDSNLNTKKLTSSEMAYVFGLDNSLVSNLYQYYTITNNEESKLTIEEFTNFILTDILSDPTYSSSIDEVTKEKIILLNKFTNKEMINKEMSSLELSQTLGIDEALVKQILLLKYSNINNTTKFTLNEFLNATIYLKNNTNYLEDLDISNIEKLVIFSNNENNINTTKLSREYLSNLFDYELVSLVYKGASIDDNYTFTPLEFIDFTLNDFSNYLDSNTIGKLNLLKIVITDNISSESIAYSASELSIILGIDNNVINKLYTLIDYSKGNTADWVATNYEFISIILNNQNNLDENEIKTIELLFRVMDSSLNNVTYSSLELSNLLEIDLKSIKNIYLVYTIKNTNTVITPIEFIQFILNNQDNLSNYLDSNTIDELKMLETVISSSINNSTYSSLELSNLFNLDKDKIDLLYAFYQYNYLNNNGDLSIYEFISFLTTDVISNSNYSNLFNQDTKDMVISIFNVMNNSLNNTLYTSDNLVKEFNSFTKDIDKNQIDLIYLYYGSIYNYQDNWMISIDKLIHYVNDDILSDKRFDTFIDKEISSDIGKASKEINEAKKLLVGDKYSRIILNTTYEEESSETFKFIKDLRNGLTDNTYLIGNSPMAYEMSKTFNNELDFITVLTMISIFVVVACTFKSIIVPIVLVLLIQCAIYVTMGIISLTGEPVYFIALLIVQSILMGATIDYAILYTSYYQENRKVFPKQRAIIESYNKSIHTILTSSSILIIVTLIVGHFASATAAMICKTLSRGTICSTILILFLLPGVLAALDRFIIKKDRRGIIN